MKNKKAIFSLFILVIYCGLVMGTASAEIFTGTVESGYTSAVFAPIGGTIENVRVVEGQRINIGDIIATLSTKKVYATQNGTVTAVFGGVGDSATVLGNRYGGVLFMEPDYNYTISASTSKAYDNDENKIVHIGEHVFINNYSDGSRKGVGVITSISGSSYTVEVTSGTFKLNETVNIYREESRLAVSRIGRGMISRSMPFEITAEGSITDIHVKPGDIVKKGDLLFETLVGDYDGSVSTGNSIKSTLAGFVSSVSLSVGNTLTKDALVLTVYEPESLWIAAQVPETDLGSVHAGDIVEIEFTWNDKVTILGHVLWISGIGVIDTSTEVTNYTAYIAFEPDEFIRCGLNVTVSTVENTSIPMSEPVDDEDLTE